MRPRNIIKAGIIGTGAVIGAVIGPPLYALGTSVAKTYRSTAKFMIERPHAATVAMLAGSLLTYGTCQHHEYMQREAMQITVKAVERYHDLHARHEQSPLEETVASYEAETKEMPQPLPVQQAEEPQAEEPSFIQEPGYNYYFVKPGDTLAGIAERISGDPSIYKDIAARNGIDDPRTVPAGTLLRIPVWHCNRYVHDVYERVPELEQTVLEDVRISEVFPDRWYDILMLNRELGLDYKDSYEGKRIVYSD